MSVEEVSLIDYQSLDDLGYQVVFIFFVLVWDCFYLSFLSIFKITRELAITRCVRGDLLLNFFPFWSPGGPTILLSSVTETNIPDLLIHKHISSNHKNSKIQEKIMLQTYVALCKAGCGKEFGGKCREKVFSICEKIFLIFKLHSPSQASDFLFSRLTRN